MQTVLQELLYKNRPTRTALQYEKAAIRVSRHGIGGEITVSIGLCAHRCSGGENQDTRGAQSGTIERATIERLENHSLLTEDY